MWATDTLGINLHLGYIPKDFASRLSAELSKGVSPKAWVLHKLKSARDGRELLIIQVDVRPDKMSK